MNTVDIMIAIIKKLCW